MKQIWKFVLDERDNSIISMPKGAEVLTVQVQHGNMCIWAMVDPAAPKEQRRFEVEGTGIGFNSTGKQYVGTVQQGPFVWHIFEVFK